MDSGVATMDSAKLESTPAPIDSSSQPQPIRPHKSNFKLKDWDAHLLRFLESAGLDQAARGFKLDILVLNHSSEKRVMGALEQFCTTAMGKTPIAVDETLDTPKYDSLDEMKQRYLPAGIATPSQNTKAISRFLADVRARVDQSNRDEFIQRKRSGPGPSGSARTDAVKLNRDVQMKYDVVKNEDGPLGKTMKPKPANPGVGRAPLSTEVTSRSAFDERFQAIETHLAVRYVPAPPADFMLRVKHIEEHIIRLEKEYPPWAALHFNQPHRGWPPPPRESLIVIPPHLTSSTRLESITLAPPLDEQDTGPGSRTKGKARAGKESSLLRAALDKLEVQKALGGQL